MSSKVDAQTVKTRLKSAQEKVLPISDVCSNGIIRTVQAHADAIGCPWEFIFYPLLTITAGFMGVRSRIKINEEWEEPAILWMVIGARKGEKKTPACSRLLKPIFDIQQQLRKKTDEGKPKPQLLIDQFSFEELHSILSANGGQVLAIYDELESFWQSLDVYKPSGCSMDRKTLLKLYNGYAWERSFRTVKGFLPKTCFNIAGFIQPQFLVDLLSSNDADGFSDRHLMLCPPEANYKFNQLKVPIPDNIASLRSVYDILMAVHGCINEESEDVPSVMYTFSDEGRQVFASEHDKYMEMRTQMCDDEQRRGVISKAVGQLARLCGTLFALEQAFQVADDDDEFNIDDWEFEIDEYTCRKGVKIMDYLIEQKMSLMPPELIFEVPVQYMSEVEEFLASDQAKIKKALEYEGSKKGSKGEISPSEAVQGRLFTPPKRNGKAENTVANATMFLDKLCNAGFGVMLQTDKSGRKNTVFNKRKFENLEQEQLDVLKKLKVDECKYKLLFDDKDN